MKTPPIQLRKRLGPISPLAGKGYEAVFAQGLPRVTAARLRRQHGSEAEHLACAIEAIHGKGLSTEELAWAARIEAARQDHHGRLGEIARVAGIHAPWGRFLLALVRELRPESVVELGTSLGISGSYLAAGLELNRGEGELITSDALENTVPRAQAMFDEMGVADRVEIVVGYHEDTLAGIIEKARPISLVFADASKKPEEVEWYIGQLAPAMRPGGVIVIDDIHWSKGLAKAWRQIRKDPRFDITADLQRVGVLRLAV